jgi:transcriptional regulator GlxA family with amidase domain
LVTRLDHRALRASKHIKTYIGPTPNVPRERTASCITRDMCMKERHASTRFGIVVYDGVEPIDIGATVGVLSMARRLLPNLETVVVAERPGPVRLAGGFVVVAEFGYDALPSCDIFIVCGGPGWRNEVTNAATLAFLRRQDATHVASVCTGAMMLAAAGVLDGRPATTRRRAVGTEEAAPLDLLNDFARGSVPRPAAVVDAGVVTGGGVCLAIDATLYLIGRFYGDDALDDVARLIEYDRAFAANKAALGHMVDSASLRG